MFEPVNPRDFIITRKRKKYRFAKFHNSPICFELGEWERRHVDVVEIGAGNGLFSVELATRHPSKIYVAVDVKGDRLQRGAYEAAERGLGNVFFVRARADQLAEMFAPGSLEQIWVTFPDPFPRKRSAARRLMHPAFLAIYAGLLSETGGLYLKHDSRDFFDWSLEQLAEQGWRIEEQSGDLQASDLPDDYKILTTYEQKWLGEGKVTNFMRATAPKN